MNKNSVFTWDALHIVDTSDVQRVRDYVFSDSLPGPMLYQDMIEQRFSSDILQRDIETDYRILVLLEKNKQRIQAIIELFSAKNYEGLYYSKTPPQ